MSTQILDQLNSYGGNNIWEDVIRRLPGYDEAATAALDPSYASDVAVIAGTTYRYDGQSQRWIEQSEA